jgi:hypothetical protein
VAVCQEGGDHRFQWHEDPDGNRFEQCLACGTKGQEVPAPRAPALTDAQVEALTSLFEAVSQVLHGGGESKISGARLRELNAALQAVESTGLRVEPG